MSNELEERKAGTGSFTLPMLVRNCLLRSLLSTDQLARRYHCSRSCQFKIF